ncbi:MAG: ABC transporter permease [Treponema sp.]|jgi:peptide/nickel transport system permease protein|nr:ABC transporter permease [Treponema sp.]
MAVYILKRLLLMIPVLLGVTFIVFFIMNLTPGDPAAIILGDQATAEALAQTREELGLNDPLVIRYVNYVKNMCRGDLGVSYRNKISVWEQVWDKFPNTCILAFAGIIVALLIGIPVGILSAKKQYTLIDTISVVLSLVGVSMPNFWLGLLLSLLFALKLGWLPSQGMGSGFSPLLRSIILPAITLGTGVAATVVRMTRSSMLEVIRQDYIFTARSKGITEKEVTRKHMFKNALIPIITAVGLQFGQLLGGAMLTETVFSWPGLGRLMVDSITRKDIPMVMGAVLFLAIMFSLVNLAVDIIYAFVDPRIKSQYKGASVKHIFMKKATAGAAS